MLKKSLATWDMKSAKNIREIYTQYANRQTFERDLIDALQVNDLQRGATWLLKHHLCQTGRFSPNCSKGLFDHLDLFDHWESQLHILQSFEYLTISTSHKKSVECFVRKCLKCEKKLIRAWGYHGFYFLSKQFPEYQTEVKALMQKALLDETPSVKARIKNILKEKSD